VSGGESGQALLGAIAATPPERCALDDGKRQLDYGQLLAAVLAEAHWLSQLAGDRCGLLADSGCGWVIADLALLSRGVLSVPIPDSFTNAQRDHLLADAHLDTMLTDRPHLFEKRLGFAVLGRSDDSGLWLLRRELAGEAPLLPRASKVTYTSGSTGSPRGVCLEVSHLLVVAQSVVSATRSLAITRHLSLLPPATLLENVAGLYAALLLGATCFVPSSSTTGMQLGRFDPERLLQTIGRTVPHSLILVPELLRVLVAAAARGWTPPPSLRFVAVGGATVAPELLARASAIGLPVYEGYGLSECGSVVCLNTPSANRRGSVGRPLPHARVRVAASGEIFVSGSVMSGYLGEAPRAMTEVATGDRGELDADGYLYVRGRLKNLFITSFGKNISPEWVERELVLHPAIAHAMVIGEARPYVVAIVSPNAGSSTADIARAVERCNASLPDYAQVRQWLIAEEPFRFDNGFLTANGRLRREAIFERHAAAIEALYATPLRLPDHAEILP
jgi:long-subunit acyl-CoA synthetase (AMP-forming)